MKRIFLLICISIFPYFLFAQTITLKFSGKDTDNEYVQLSKVLIKNNTKDWEETLLWPDTVLVLSTTGINDITSEGFQLAQNIPNPFDGKTSVLLTLPQANIVTLELFDLTGKKMAFFSQNLNAGTHRFNLTLSQPQTYFLSARTDKSNASIKLSNIGNGGGNSIVYAEDFHSILTTKNAIKFYSDQSFNIGDNMTYTGYATIGGIEKEVTKNAVLQPGTNTVYFSFEPSLTNTCPGVPTVTDYDNNVYNTVQIGNQCWMRENLKTTHFSNGDAIPQENNANMSTPTYAYPNNMGNNASTYGLLYNWPAVMNGASSSEDNPSNVQGICPTGWHVPSDTEWKEMELAIGVPSEEIDNMDEYRGTVAATLAGGYDGIWENSTAENTPGNLDAANRNSTGFTALPAGNAEGFAVGFKQSSAFWTSTLYIPTQPIYHLLNYAQSGILRSHIEKAMNSSVRCVKNR